MSSPIIVGTTGTLYREPGTVVTQSADGSAQSTVIYSGTWVDVITHVPTPTSTHPDFPSLLLYDFSMTNLPGGLGQLSCVYRGVLAVDPSAYYQKEYTISQTTEPIETHPLFAYPRDSPPVSNDEIAAVQKAINQDAAYSSTNAAATMLWEKKRRGIDSYLRLGGCFKQDHVSGDIPSIPSSVGKIVSTLPTDCPSPIAHGANYLFSSYSWKKTGGLVQISETYLQSGAGGWDPDLYG
jgi:hypothetical protein